MAVKTSRVCWTPFLAKSDRQMKCSSWITPRVTGVLIMCDNTSPRCESSPCQRTLALLKATTKGLAHARGDYIALVNPDTTVNERWLAELIHTIELDPDIAAAVPKIYRASEPAIIEQAGRSSTTSDTAGHAALVSWTEASSMPY